MKYKLMSLGLGIALSLGILLFMATLVEPPRGEKVASEQKSIVINMQNEVTEVQVRERPVPQEPDPLPEPPAALAARTRAGANEESWREVPPGARIRPASQPHPCVAGRSAAQCSCSTLATAHPAI